MRLNSKNKSETKYYNEKNEFTLHVNFNIKANADAALFNTGAIDNIDIRQKLINDKNSGYSGMKMPDEIIEEDGEENDN